MHKLLLLHLFLLSNLAQAKNPSQEKIQSWLQINKIEIIQTQSIFLEDNERAYLVKIKLPNKEALVLARPELDEAKIIPNLPKDYIITDLDHNGVSELIFSQEENFENYVLYKRSLVQMHDYKRFELYTKTYKEETNCKLCLVEDVQWGFEDLNRNKIKDLRQDYILYIKSHSNKLSFKQKVQEIDFNQEGMIIPSRPVPLNLSHMQISKNVINREAISITKDFSLEDQKVFCLLDFKEVKKESTVTYHWIHEELGEVLALQQKVHPAKRFRTWIYKSLNYKKKYLGNWIIIITDKYKNILATKEFNIRENNASK